MYWIASNTFNVWNRVRIPAFSPMETLERVLETVGRIMFFIIFIPLLIVCILLFILFIAIFEGFDDGQPKMARF